ncbi:hypothetical protein GWI33_005258 [Rhynchophorus ferrugineus]|uniref:Uncharacterized protein n=1 Tax=Rhynchophorus ferrugineus TaxID=354439 RepID=A0A834MDY5_RHYFE|nr:hypothetical protein GWI33_005258 [Rhynchophorus ferrugineus]
MGQNILGRALDSSGRPGRRAAVGGGWGRGTPDERKHAKGREVRRGKRGAFDSPQIHSRANGNRTGTRNGTGGRAVGARGEDAGSIDRPTERDVAGSRVSE